eukprot:CAMPEP_0197662170 /NCGR_PEP_ID=MMETSP1338-20131121/52353_1 /TAXON_ID=43686 ORGANISM="Pelagodinium beii, Strain RCC1491" /NCGR_SAMPLE_ID=MMETSP1338 /ASSEMBLY_ACC=CAM_ASM_000754 /LENGTH=525 /DNA_ID=CAMNT_0043239895 /DNA_START=200 /DNA_END=1777 /DNA_ORIENTATION=-
MATSRIINKAATHAIAPSDPTEEEMFMAAYANGTRPMSSGILRAEQCPSCRKLINYPEALRNSPTGDWHATAGVLVLWVFALLWLLNTTAQDFFVPPLVYWSKLLCLRPEISGATLVALGNGAPDAFAMITATRAEDVPLALTTVLGSMMSVLCITGSAIVFTAEQLHSRAKSSGDSGKQMDLNFHPTFDSTSAVGLSAGILYMAVLMQTGQASVDKAVVMPVLYALYLMVLTRQPAAAVEETAENEKEAVGATPALPGLDMPTNASWLRLLPWGLAWLTYVARWILIPPSDRHWDRTRRVFSSLAPTGVILFWAKTSLGSCAALFANPASTVALLLGLLASVAIYAGSDDGPSLPFFYPALTLLAKASSILVLSVIAGELTACVETLGLVLGVARLSLGTTVMSWGNSLGDLVVGLAMVRQGQCRAAFTAVFAGPIFNCLFSAGIVLTCAAASTNSGVVMLWTDDAGRTNLRLHVAFLAVACSVLTLTLRFQQSAGNFAPFALLVLYSAFLACSLSVEQSELQS